MLAVVASSAQSMLDGEKSSCWNTKVTIFPHPQASALTVMEHFLIHKISEETRNSALLPTHVIFFHLCFFIIISGQHWTGPHARAQAAWIPQQSHHMPASQRRVKIFYGGQMVSHCLIFRSHSPPPFIAFKDTFNRSVEKLARNGKWKLKHSKEVFSRITQNIVRCHIIGQLN